MFDRLRRLTEKEEREKHERKKLRAARGPTTAVPLPARLRNRRVNPRSLCSRQQTQR